MVESKIQLSQNVEWELRYGKRWRVQINEVRLLRFEKFINDISNVINFFIFVFQKDFDNIFLDSVFY